MLAWQCGAMYDSDVVNVGCQVSQQVLYWSNYGNQVTFSCAKEENFACLVLKTAYSCYTKLENKFSEKRTMKSNDEKRESLLASLFQFQQLASRDYHGFWTFGEVHLVIGTNSEGEVLGSNPILYQKKDSTPCIWTCFSYNFYEGTLYDSS